MIDWFMFTLNLFIVFGAMTSEPLLHYHHHHHHQQQQHRQSVTPSDQKLQISSARKNLRYGMIEVELMEYNQQNKSFVKTGITQLFNASFSRLGTKDSVGSGLLKQVHICQDEYDRVSNISWIAVFKLESSVHHRRQCKNVITKAKMALTNRASAVIFDVSLDKNVSKLLNRKSVARLSKPVLIVRGRAAKKLQKLLMQNHSAALAKVRLPDVLSNSVQKADHDLLGQQGHLTLATSFSVVGFLFVVAVVLTVKAMGKRPPLRQALKNMRLVVYSELKDSTTDTQCSICFDDYQSNELVRLLPCLHFFHKKCVDRWLLSKKTCPLCLLDVMSGQGHATKRTNHSPTASTSGGLAACTTSDGTPGLCHLCTSLPTHLTPQATQPSDSPHAQQTRRGVRTTDPTEQ